MHLHILGVAGSFMAGIARIATEAGHRVTGSDESLFPPMSTQLEQAGVKCQQGYDWTHMQPEPDCVVVGNVMRRGIPIIEQLLNSSLAYTSGPQWLKENLLQQRHVLAVAGTHGKTTTSAMLAHLLIEAGLEPGYLVGGVAAHTGKSAQMGCAPYFVIEADEYDTAFFDKRSKFVHYCPSTLILNNLEYDHADIFEDLEAIQKQFHHLVRVVPSDGRILCCAGDVPLQQVLEMGCWTPVEYFGFEEDCDWRCVWAVGEGLRVVHQGQEYQTTDYRPIGAHNALNATAAVAAAHHAGVAIDAALHSLASFAGVARRLTLKSTPRDGIRLYDDFAHHPTEIRATIEAVKGHHREQKVLAIVEPASNSMRGGAHRAGLAEAMSGADEAWLYVSQKLDWDTQALVREAPGLHIVSEPRELLEQLRTRLDSGGVILAMSNRPGSDLCHHLETHL